MRVFTGNSCGRACPGEGQDRMIAYEAAPGEQVIIRGSRVITTTWELSIDPNGPPRAAAEAWTKTSAGFPREHLFQAALDDDAAG